jgi:hypothetical protein
MKRRVPLTCAVAAIAVAMAIGAPAGAQELTAEVKTWGGQSVRLAQPSLEVFYTIIPRSKDGEPGGLAPERSEIPPTAGASGQEGGARLFGTHRELKKAFDRGPEPVSAQREQGYFTVSRDGVETRVPFARLARLQIVRQPLASTLPPYVAAQHYRYAAAAVLVDGTSIQGDYVNFGTTLLRGMSPQGRVAIPLEDIETLRLDR